MSSPGERSEEENKLNRAILGFAEAEIQKGSLVPESFHEMWVYMSKKQQPYF